MNEKPAQLATRYLGELWRKRFNATPPMDLMQAVVTTVIKVGYTKKLVETMFNSYIKNSS